jgi:hypothetical protein
MVRRELVAKAQASATSLKWSTSQGELMCLFTLINDLGPTPSSNQILSICEDYRAARLTEVQLTEEWRLGQNDQASDSMLELNLIGFCYFCSTLLGFFTDNLSEERIQEAADIQQGSKSIEQLTIARRTFSVDPILAWSAVEGFRKAGLRRSVSLSGW